MQVKVREECPKCEEGMIYNPHCRACGQRIPSGHPWWSSPDDTMPCGHSAHRHLVEEYDCPNCEGSGWVERWIDLTEFADQLVEPLRMVQGVS